MDSFVMKYQKKCYAAVKCKRFLKILGAGRILPFAIAVASRLAKTPYNRMMLELVLDLILAESVFCLNQKCVLTKLSLDDCFLLIIIFEKLVIKLKRSFD
jgi:hypothetical protein